ncbi:MAG: hypothetical protein EB073_08810 [Burkholderiaceae bacterium]|nr:hypothetical protein [Burkholderiaceae bacterium]
MTDQNRSLVFAILLAISVAPVHAMTSDELEIEKLNQIEAQLTLQREWTEYRWKKRMRNVMTSSSLTRA